MSGLLLIARRACYHCFWRANCASPRRGRRVRVQVVIDFEIYRTVEEVVDPRADMSRPRSVPVDTKSEAGKNIGVLKSDRVAQLSVQIGASDKPRTERTVNLFLNFGATEITARAEATHSDDSKKVIIKYE